MQPKQTDGKEEYIFVRAGAKGKLIKVNMKDVLYIKGLSNYQKTQTVDKQIVSRFKMKNLEEQLNPINL